MKPPKPRPSPPPSKTVLGAEKWLLNRMRGKVRFFQFSHSLKNTPWGQNFLFCAKVALVYFRTTWFIFHRASTKNYRRIEASPMAL
jgi:hypothetical protein